MTTDADSIPRDAAKNATGPGGDSPHDRLQAARGSLRRAKRRDRLARWVITLGGAAVIVSVLAILAAIVSVAVPLFRPARCVETARGVLPAGIAPAGVLALGVEPSLGESSTSPYALLADGTAVWFDPATGEALKRQSLAPSAIASSSGSSGDRPQISCVESSGPARYSLLWSDGAVSLVEIAPAPDGKPSGGDTPGVGTVKILKSLPPRQPRTKRALVRYADDGTTTIVRLAADGQVEFAREKTVENMLGEKETTEQRVPIDTGGLGPITVLAMDFPGSTLYAGTSTGQLARWKVNADGRVVAAEALTAFPDHRAVTALALAMGGESLCVGDARGEVTVWSLIRRDEKLRLTQRLSLAQHGSAIEQLVPTPRTRGLWSLDAEGAIRLDHITSRRNLVSLNSAKPALQLGISARGEAMATLDADGEATIRHLDAPHPEVSLGALFGRVWYESYDEPQFAWQTTGGDDFEAKFSLVPLISGTLKGTFYAMLLAGPLGLFGAIYVSHFTTPQLKRIIKPTIEIMAAVPSVVLGFLAALWLAPLLENGILVVFLSFATIPAAFVAFLAVWQWARRFETAKRIENGYEFLLTIPVLAAGVAAAWLLAPSLESLCFDGSFRQWLYQSLDLRYDQRNCVVIAFALGFTVIPILLSLAEDSLSGVPHTLTAASMALGASRWQTVWRVILPSASPGIFAGMMIALGRAVGETMIVLMATGNTPITSWSPLNGMRTLSANIAVEAPEAPVGGTHYRVLFLCAVLLFVLTFTLNTAAEIVRQRLRRRYAKFS